MVLMQIAEPGASEIAAEGPRKVGVGIDLGTTNSLIAHFDGDRLSVLPDEAGAASLPSVAYYGQAEVIVGNAAVVLAAEHSADTIASAKRFMGKGRNEVSDEGYLEFADEDMAFATTRGPVTPVEVSADILRALASRASVAGLEQLDGVVITVPAYFDDAQRQATRQAAELAGLPVLRLLNEPTAAAVAYGLDSAEEGVVAVYDLGGGTFDISILRLERGVFEVLATGGDSALGGDDFDRLLADHLTAAAALDNLTVGQRRGVIACARDVKELLSEQNSCTVSLDHIVAGTPEVVVDRSTLNDLCGGLVSRSLDACRQCIEDAGIEQVDRIVLVGGSTRMPLVKEAVAELFGREPLTHIDPDQVVAMGAARQADLLVGNRGKDDLLLLDVIPLSLGVETYGGLVERLVHRNTTIPVVRAQEFTTARDGQTGLLVHVVQGERERVEDCRSLARFELSGIPPMVAGAARILVTFQVDADGLLEVSAKEESTGETAHVVVKPSFGLADITIAEMLRAGYENAGTDMQARQLTEARVDAEQLAAGIYAALEVDGDLLDESERGDLLSAVQALEAIAGGDDVESIRSATEHTGKVSELFAARRMDQSIQQALGGISLEALEQEVGE